LGVSGLADDLFFSVVSPACLEEGHRDKPSGIMRKIYSLFGLMVMGAAALGAPRSWTDVSGRKVEADFAGMQGDSVLLKLANGQTVPFPLARLSAEDQAFAKTQTAGAAVPVASESSSAASGEVSRVPVEKRVWPENVAVSAKSVEIAPVTENAAERKYVYRSEAFEFTSQAKLAGSVMKEVARTFEATKSLIEALPWGVTCKPPEGRERFLAALYETRDDYVAAGGPELSGGVYNSGDKIFKIPFQSLGFKKLGQTYARDDNFSNATLIHEITHQLMDDYLGFLPKWVIEGTAEYTEMLPYKAGIFRADSHKNGLKEDTERWVKQEGFPLDLGSLETLMTMNRDQWDAEASTARSMSAMYHRAQLLVYYFCHLDGDKKGTRFIKFMDAAYGQVAELRAFFADPRVKRMEGGRFSYPRDFPPPDMDPTTAPFKNLPLLLDERPYAKLAAEIMDGFKSIGIKVVVR
jgi:hypothetical protein